MQVKSRFMVVICTKLDIGQSFPPCPEPAVGIVCKSAFNRRLEIAIFCTSR